MGRDADGMMGWLDVREPVTGKLLFRYDPERNLIEIQRRGVVTVVDLNHWEYTHKMEERQGAPKT